MAAIVSGCYVVSSNRGGTDSEGQTFGGRGWVVDPAGELVAQTSSASPLAVYHVDLEWVARAQREYPCYVRERTAR
jgi:N-carbamoylputrescine amidase